MHPATDPPHVTAPAPSSLGANYRRLWGSSAASNLADGIFYVGLPLIALRLTDSPMLIAGVAVVGRLPWLLFVLVAGALADRLDRRRTMVNVQLLRVAVMGSIAVLAMTDLLSLPMLYAAALLLGIGETLFDTAAQSLMPSLVRPDQLSRANGRLYAIELVMNQFVGPPLGGLLVAVSVPLALGSAAVGFAIAALGLALITGSFKPVRTGPPRSMVGDITEGLRYLMAQRVLRTLAVMVGVMNLAASAIFAVFVLYAVAPGPMGLSEGAYGLLMTGFAIGSLAGTLVVERVEQRLGPSRLLLLAVIVAAVAVVVPALTTDPLAVTVSFIVGGAVVVMWNVVTVSLRQRIVPDELLGRVNASYRLLAWGTQPVGALLGGVVASLFGVQAVFVLGGVLTGILVLVRPLISDAAIAAAEAASTRAPGTVHAGLTPKTSP